MKKPFLRETALVACLAALAMAWPAAAGSEDDSQGGGYGLEPTATIDDRNPNCGDVVSICGISELQQELQIKKIEEGLGMYAAKHKGKYPTTSEGLEAAAKYMGSTGEVPMDAWGNAFQYFSPGTNGDHKYEIISLGGDGKEGGDDTDADIKSWELK